MRSSGAAQCVPAFVQFTKSAALIIRHIVVFPFSPGWRRRRVFGLRSRRRRVAVLAIMGMVLVTAVLQMLLRLMMQQSRCRQMRRLTVAVQRRPDAVRLVIAWKRNACDGITFGVITFWWASFSVPDALTDWLATIAGIYFVLDFVGRTLKV